MYKVFYSLSKTPFSKEVTSKEAYPSTPFNEAAAALDYLKTIRGIGLVVGEPGAGKTLALRVFAESLNPSLYKVMYFPLSTGTVMDFYRGLTIGLGEAPTHRKVDLFLQIQQAVHTLFRERKVTPVFILDEMHMAKDTFLQDITILFNFKMDSLNPFILILAGLPFLQDRLSLNQNRPLAQRLVMRIKLEALDREEVAGYIAHHMHQAGARHAIFDESAIEAITSCSRGWPRIINHLATHALIYGFQMKKDTIDAEIIRHVATELRL